MLATEARLQGVLVGEIEEVEEAGRVPCSAEGGRHAAN
jgi:hypothetical protein